MLKYDCLEELLWDFAYTKEEIRQVIADAHGFGMEVIPMANHLGHASQSRSSCGKHVVLDQNPALQTLFEPDGWTWCLTNPKVLSLLKRMREELMELCGDGSYFHIGCDEAYSFASCPACSETNRTELLLNCINGVAQELFECGRNAIVWGDALLSCDDWSFPYIASSRSDQKTHEMLDALDRKIITADGQYDITDHQCKTSEYFKEKGFSVLASPWHDMKNVHALTGIAIEEGLHGALITTWHTLPSHINLILSASSYLWEGVSETEKRPDSLAATYTASFLRKLCPPKGDFGKAGWRMCEQTEIQSYGNK